ncbi:hypothetical protein [Hymenobacter siberiensis]|uniref:hypothetical protein n=1 Tax=Hymenobacter siberiensis TaxID=2848396 RepID=UPI001C1E46D1|nr:hypothetical protein [Hymenobacter siberiensis]
MEDLFAGIFEQMFTYLLLLPVGFGYLWLRYRNKLRVKETLAKEYENSYANAGSVVLINTIAALLALAVGSLVILAIVVQIREWLKS